MLRLLPPLLIALLVFAAPAPAAKKKAPRCGKTTVAIGPKKKPRACVPKTLPAANPRILKPLVKVKPDRRLEKLARQRFSARAAQAGDGLPPGIEMVENNGLMELRNKAGDTLSMGYSDANTVPKCPRANGDVPAKLDVTMVFGAGDAVHGKRTWMRVTVRNEATWTGHVGVGAKAETVDIAFRGELRIESGVEIAATGKALKRNPTRTYRSALTKKGVPVKFDPIAIAQEMTFRGPKGRSGNAEDFDAASRLYQTSLIGLMEIPDALEKGDKRWFDERACATRDYTWTPEKVVKSGRADWHAWVMAEDGTRVADARWTMASGCGTPTATSASGPEVKFGVLDEAGAWGPPSTGACMSVDVTSPAGRAAPIFHSIPPLEATRYRYEIRIDFRKDMGPNVVATDATGLGRVTVGPDEGFVEGEGTFLGTEWDGTVSNPCGHDMLRSRSFTSPVSVGAKIEGDKVTIGFTAIERPLDAAWIVTLPVTGGQEFWTSYQPFCGTPDAAFRFAKMTVTATPVA